MGIAKPLLLHYLLVDCLTCLSVMKVMQAVTANKSDAAAKG